MCYVLLNIAKEKRHYKLTTWEPEVLYSQDYDESGGVSLVKKKQKKTLCTFVTSIWHLCGYWELARWTTVIYINQVFLVVKSTHKLEWAYQARSFWCPEIVVETVECSTLAIDLAIRITCKCAWCNLCWTFSGKALATQGLHSYLWWSLSLVPWNKASLNCSTCSLSRQMVHVAPPYFDIELHVNMHMKCLGLFSCCVGGDKLFLLQHNLGMN